MPSDMSISGASYGESAGSPGPTQGSRFGPAPPTARHPLPSSGVALLPHELDRSFSCVRASLRLLCHDAKLAYGEDGVEEVLSELPTRAGAAFQDGFAPQSVESAYTRLHAALSPEERLDPSRCISLFLELVRKELYEPVLLLEQVEGIRLGDVGDRGRTESPKSLHARMAPQLLLMELGCSQAVRMFLNALQPHPRHVLHDQGSRLVERSMAAYARTPKPAPDSVELALGRAEAAATQVYDEFIGMLQLGRVAGKPAPKKTAADGTADLLGQLKGGDPAAVKAAQRLVRQLHTALVAHGTPATAPVHPAQPKQWCEHHQRYTGHSTADCNLHRQQAAPSQPAQSHAASQATTPSEQALFEQFKAFMSMRPAAAAAPLRAHTPMQSRTAPPRMRPHCDHCGKDGHTEERCFSKHPELRPATWAPLAASHSLLTAPSTALGTIDEGMDDDAALHSFTTVPIASASQAQAAMQSALAAAASAAGPAAARVLLPAPITSPHEAYHAMRHALAGAVVRPLGFTPGSAAVRAAPSSSSTSTAATMLPQRLPPTDAADSRVQALEALVSGMQQQVFIMQAQLAQLHAEQPLAQAVAAATASSAPSPTPATAGATPATAVLHAGPVGLTRPASTLPALPFAANPCVSAGFSVLDRHGNPHAVAGVMIDSGSGAQLMTATMARQLQLEVLPSQLRIIQSGGTEFQTMGATVVEVGLALGTPHAARSRHRFQVVADSSCLPYSLLVGTEIIHRHGIQLDLPGRLLTYAPCLASHGQPQPRHALPLYFEPPAAWSSGILLSQSSVVATSCVSSLSSTSTEGSIASTPPPPATALSDAPAAAPAAFDLRYVHRALPYAANPSVSAGLSVRDSAGKPWAPYGVMLDSGSSAQLISQGLVDLLRLPVDSYHLRVMQSGGVAFNTVGSVTLEVGLALGTPHEARSRHRFYVVDSNQLPYSLLIGTEVMYQHGIQVDLRSRHLTYSYQLASLGQLQPRHALPLLFNSSSLPCQPLYACVACPARCEGEQGSSGQSGVSYLGAPGAESSASSAAPGCSLAPSVAEANPVSEIRGLTRGPRSKPCHGTDRPQLPARSPKHQALGLAAARRLARRQQRTTPPPPGAGSGWTAAGQELIATIRKGCTLRNITALLLILCALLPTLHACPPHELPAVPAMPYVYSSIAIEHTLPGGQQHLPPDVRFTKHPKGMLFGNHPGMTAAEHAALQAVVEGHDSAFSYSLSDLPGYHGPRPPFSIPLTSDQPVRTRPRRYSPLERQVCIDKTAELQAAGIVSPVEGPCNYAAAPVLPAKKDVHGNWTEKRFAIDFRQLNAATKPDIYGLPRPDEMFSELGDSCFFSKLDMRSGFFQLVIAPADRIKTAFWCGNKLYQFNRMPFGLRNAPAEYQRVMDRCIADARLTHCCKAYIDDLLIHSTSAEQHLADVTAALRMLQANGLKAHPDKSLFGADVVEYLGHNVSSHGLSPTEAKVAAVTALPTPTCLHDLRQIMGFINYYRCYVPDFSAIAAPITRLTSKGVSWVWGEEQQQAFATLKAAICTPGLVLRRADPDRPFTLHTDWSTAGCGAVLGQTDDAGQEYMVACISRSNNKHERNYSSYQGEMLCAVWAIKTLRPYLHGAAFRLVTDHQPLTWLMTNPNLTGHHARWALSLQDYTFTIEHRPGNKHQNADVLSRWPLPGSLDGTGAQLDPDPAAALACFPSPTPSESVVWACAAYWPFDSDYATHPADLLWGNLGGDLDATFHPPAPPSLPSPTAALHRHVAAMCQLAAPTLTTLPAAVTFTGMSVGHQDAHGVAQPLRLNTTLVSTIFFPAATRGIVLLELFGGLCAGLDMCLRNGIPIHRYLYCDIDPAAQRIAHHRVAVLASQYPTLLPASAYAAAFTTLPADVRAITTTHLVNATPTGVPWLVVAGWECQDLSPAGSQAGMHGQHSSTHVECLRIIGSLQQLQPNNPPGYILENAAVQLNFSSPAVRSQLQPLCELFGEPVCFDAATTGSYAHRVRNYWTNLCDTAALAAVLAFAGSTSAQVQDILDPGRTPPLASVWPPPPALQCEAAGLPLRILPTLVATPGSYAFRDRGPGLMLNPDGTSSEPTVPERERALGYGTGATAALGVTTLQRFIVLGRCMDAYAMQTLLAISLTLSRPQPSPSLASCACVPGGSVGPQPIDHPAHPVGSTASPACLTAAVVAAVDEDTDIHADTASLHFLRTGAHQPGLSATELRRVSRRAKSYRWDSGKLLRAMADGSAKIVPAPDARDQLVLAMHGSNGHFGVRRTTALLLHNHWWAGIHADVARVLRSCHVCDRARASFNLRAAQLSPLPMQGLFYRWGVDLAGPLPRTHRGNEYLMVCIEHLTKHVELVPIPDRLASTTAYHFHHQVLGRFGASAEVLTDGGREFQGEFADLLQRHLIDHRTTSPHHPQADGLAERAVQTFKDALRKHIAVSGDPAAWDEALPAIALGYRVSPQEATKCSPYSLLYGRAPVLPPAVVQRMTRPVNLDDPLVAAQDLLSRTATLSRETAAAMGNMRIAQHRDTLRYALTHSGSYKPAARQLHPGSFVWTQRPQTNSLQLGARPEIYRVVSVGANGVVKLMGKCGRTMAENVCNLAPCHLPDIDPTIDHTLARPTADFPCSLCKSPADADRMLLCDGCGKGYHIFCLTPTLTTVPEGTWLCAGCTGSGLTNQEVHRRTQAVAAQPVAPPLREVFTSKQGRDRARAAQLLHGRMARHPATNLWGVVRFKGQQYHPHYFSVDWVDGTVTDNVSPTMLRNSGWLQPEGTALPTRTPSPAPALPSQRRSARLGHRGPEGTKG